MRVTALAKTPARLVFACPPNSAAWRRLVAAGRWDVFCCHHAQTRQRGQDYKSPAFDAADALAANTAGLPQTLAALSANGCRALVFTSTFFETGEGGDSGNLALSAYGLSKFLTGEFCRHHAAACGMRFARFVVPNPFGPMEDARFAAHLMRHWRAGKTPTVETPNYKRDNIHIGLLAAHYARFVLRAAAKTGGGALVCRPSGYAQTQGAFARRFAREMQKRLPWRCPLKLASPQTNWSEPRRRVNPGCGKPPAGWSEAQAWDDIANYYRDLGDF